MLINVDNLINGESRDISFSENVKVPDDYSVNGDAFIDVSGNISNNEGKFHFCGKVLAKMNFNCDLCLRPFDTEIVFDIDEIFCKEADDESDFWSFSDKVIDLEPAILSNILLNIPMKAVCSDDCKGLCSICGHNLNDGDCGCDRTYINPKFEKLKELFKETENDEEV